MLNLENSLGLAIFSVLNSKWAKDHKYYSSTFNIPELNITTDTTLNQIVETGMIPNNGIVELWCNDSSSIGREVRSGIRGSYHNENFYGTIIFHRFVSGSDETINMVAKEYCNTKIFVNVYSNINNVKWYKQWTLLTNDWSNWIDIGTNGIGIDAQYRYNNTMVEFSYSGHLNEKTISSNSFGYPWYSKPAFMPEKDMQIPVAFSQNGLIIRFYSSTSDESSGLFTLTSIQNDITSNEYITGSFIYSRIIDNY